MYDIAVFVLPYSQLGHAPKAGDWPNITRGMSSNSLLFVSPNSCAKSQPITLPEHQIVRINCEPTIEFLTAIYSYLTLHRPKLRRIRIVATDVHKPRIQRDFEIVFVNWNWYRRELDITDLQPSLLKQVYQIRERLLMFLPIKTYGFLSRLSGVRC